LIRQLRTHRDLGVIVYSGYRLKSLRRLAKQNPAVSGLLAQIDLLIDGPYIAERNDGVPLRGSANQGVIPLSGRYLPFLSSYDPNQPRNVELHLDIGERMLVGIPSSRQLTWWNAHKAE
jgi:anaerobic ribonucleoside-triphosphate reductase activating protein